MTWDLERLLAPALVAGRAGIAPAASELAAVRSAITEAPARLRSSPAELHARLTEAISGRRPDLAMQALFDSGVLAQVLPELAATVDFSQEAGRRHKDVWEHTKTVVWQSVPKPTVRWAALLHDIGKVPTREFLANGGVTFHGHTEVGLRMFRRGPARRIEFPTAEREVIAELIRLHLRPGQYESSWTDSAVRRFALEVGPNLTDLLNLSRADVTSRRPGKRKHALARISELSRRIRALEAEDRKPKPLPAGLGHALMAALALPAGPAIGQVRAGLQALVESGELEGGREPDYYVEPARRVHAGLAGSTSD